MYDQTITTKLFAFIRSSVLKLSALICVNLLFICG